MTTTASEHHRWNLGRLVSRHGYVKIRVGRGHPLADPKGYAYEHLVVWCSAGRAKPGPGETLHHRNGDKSDNRLGNLELITRSAHGAMHSAQRRRDASGRFARLAEVGA